MTDTRFSTKNAQDLSEKINCYAWDFIERGNVVFSTKKCACLIFDYLNSPKEETKPVKEPAKIPSFDEWFKEKDYTPLERCGSMCPDVLCDSLKHYVTDMVRKTLGDKP